MNIRHLLVHLDTSAVCEARVALACALARRFDAHLSGLAPTGWVQMPVDVGVALGSPNYVQLSMEHLRRRAEDAAERFRTQAQGLRSVDVVIDEQDAAPSVVVHGRCTDLIIVGQHHPDDLMETGGGALAEQALMLSGRPVLVVPYIGAPAVTGQRVLLAWKPTREAARAVADAMPLLQAAAHVDVVAFEEAGTPANAAQLDALGAWLSRHGVRHTSARQPQVTDVGNALLSYAADRGSDLLVMGGYGHSRLREWALGGATRSLLAQMTIPVLMSH